MIAVLISTKSSEFSKQISVKIFVKNTFNKYLHVNTEVMKQFYIIKRLINISNW